MEKLKGRMPSASGELVQKIYELYDTGIYGYLRIAKTLDTTQGTVLYYVRKRKKENAAIRNEQQHNQVT